MRNLVLIVSVRQNSLKVKKLFCKNVFDPDHSCFMPTLVLDRELFDLNKAVSYSTGFRSVFVLCFLEYVGLSFARYARRLCKI